MSTTIIKLNTTTSFDTALIHAKRIENIINEKLINDKVIVVPADIEVVSADLDWVKENEIKDEDEKLKELFNDSKYINIRFQDGPIKESGANGCQTEDVIQILINRMNDFQLGEFPTRENALVITKLQEALMWLEVRTKDRTNRGVEGTNKQ